MTNEYSLDVMNVGEVAAYLRVSQATIYRLAQAGQIPCGKVGRAWRFHKEAINLWISGDQDGSTKITTNRDRLE